MKVAIFSRGFRPPTRAHVWVVRRLATLYPRVIVRPRGMRKDGEFDPLTAAHRAELVRIAFEGIDDSRVMLDFSDIGRPLTPAIDLFDEFGAGGLSPVFVVGSGLILNGEVGSSDIQDKWKQGRRLWNEAPFRVVARDDECSVGDLPPHNDGPVIACRISASATLVREAYADGNVAAAERQLPPRVAAYIRTQRLFRQIDSSI